MKNIIVSIIITLVVFGISYLLFVGILEEKKQWKQFVSDNNCQKAGYIDSSVSVGVGVSASNGSPVVVPVITPKKDRWVCDNSVEIYR